MACCSIHLFCLLDRRLQSHGGTPAQASGAEKPKGAKEIVLPASQQGDGLLQFEAVQLANQAEYKPYREKLFLLMIEAGTWE